MASVNSLIADYRTKIRFTRPSSPPRPAASARLGTNSSLRQLALYLTTPGHFLASSGTTPGGSGLCGSHLHCSASGTLSITDGMWLPQPHLLRRRRDWSAVVGEREEKKGGGRRAS